MKYYLFKLLPKNLISRITGVLMHLPLPAPIAQASIKFFADAYKINLEEAEMPYTQYKNIGDFFTRRLKAGARPIAEALVVHPADSVITQIGEIFEGKLIQAKDRYYSVADLCEDREALMNFENGLFATYYLCPTDYHRVHSPVDGEVTRVTHIPGELWPVNAWSTENVENLFPRNERVVLEIKTDLGRVHLIFVGATNVGQIGLAFDPEFRTNLSHKLRVEKKTVSVRVKRGDELGVFYMGSTVVMLYPEAIKNKFPDWKHWLGQKVRMGGPF